MTPRRKITAQRLHELLHYNHNAGEFTWKIAQRKPWLNGTVAGASHTGGYIRIHVDGRTYFAHRLAWLYVYGEWPADQIDHINGIRNDNRIFNLRQATSAQNHANTYLRIDNSSGIKGVSRHSTSGRWRARLHSGGAERHLGFFDTKEAAAAAYRKAAEEHFGEFANPTL